MAHGGPQLIPDKTIFIQLGLFIASFVTLKKLVIDPYVKLIHLRNEKTTGLSDKAQKEAERSEALKHQYEDFMKLERKKITHWLDTERTTLSEEEKGIISTARNEVAKELSSQRDALNKEADKVRKELRARVAEFSSLIASKLLGTKVALTEASGGSGSSSKHAEKELQG